MLSPNIEVPRSLMPSGIEVIQSDVVDIYPLSNVTSFHTTRIDLAIPAAMGAAEEAQYLGALRREHDFIVKRLGKNLPPMPNTDDIETNHRFFVERGLAKLGLRNVCLQGNALTGEHCLVPHPAYSQFSESQNPRLREFGANLGAAVILVTADRKLIIQHRNPANRVYGDVPGASVAGLVDASLDTRIDILSEMQVFLLGEGSEEIGLAPSVTESFVLNSMQIDKKALHNELTFRSRATLTGDEIADNALRNQHKDNAASFRENIVIIDATPRNVELLLTEVGSPFPMTHAGPVLMLGRELTAEAGANERDWLMRVKAGMDENYARIDARSSNGRYSPGTSATAQGLPSFRDELQRVFPGQYRYVACAW
jgi:hypothetical protein